MRKHIISIALLTLGVAGSMAAVSELDSIGRIECMEHIKLTESPEKSSAYTDNWKKIGNGRYTEDYFTTLLNVGNPTWEVEIEENTDSAGVYRIVNPYGAGCPIFNEKERFNGYLIINASNPEGVYIEPYKTGTDLGLGMGEITLTSWCRYWLDKGKTLEDEINSGGCGKVIDGVITFPKKKLMLSIATEDGDLGLYANYFTSFKLSLPDAPDYNLSLSSETCTGHPEAHHVSYESSNDFKCLRYLFKKAYDGTNEYGDNEKSYVMAAKIGKDMPLGKGELSFDLTSQGEGKYLFIAVGLNSDSTIVARRCAEFYYQPDDNDNWVSHGKTLIEEDIIGSIYTECGVREFEAEFQTHKTVRGLYRLVNPYDNYVWLPGQTSRHSDHNHYIYIHAEDPSLVYLMESPTGMDHGFGQIRVSSTVSLYMMYGNPLSAIIRLNPFIDVFGKYNEKTGVITFPKNALKFSEQRLQGGDWIDANSSKKFKLHVPQSAGTEEIMAPDDSECEYFNMQGQRVTNPSNGIFIRVQGTKSEKVILK